MSRCNLFRVSAGTAALLAFCWCGLLSGCSDSRPVKAPPVSDPDPPMAAAPAPSPSMSSDAADEGTPAAAPTLPGSGGLDAFRADLESADQQIDATLASLAELTDPKQEDLRAAYDRYCDQLARMQESADAMKREADAMRESRNAYFASWEERTSDVDNPTIRASAEAQRRRLRDAHDQIVTASVAARDAYVPFMGDLQDIKKYLATELSPASVAELSDAAKKVRADGATVKQKIAAIIKTLDQVEGSGAAGGAAGKGGA